MKESEYADEKWMLSSCLITTIFRSILPFEPFEVEEDSMILISICIFLFRCANPSKSTEVFKK